MEHLRVYKSPLQKERIGPYSDGGYVVCKIEQTTYDLFISGGIGNDIRFEQHMLYLYPNLKCIAFDGTISKLPFQVDRLEFHRINLGSENTPTTTDLHDTMGPYNNIFMKIDIEGHEFRLFPKLIENGDIQKIKQLVLEIHTPADISLYPEYFKGLEDISQPIMDKTLSWLNETHRLVHIHGNNGCKTHERDKIVCPNVFECTYLRISDFEGTEWEYNREEIPNKILDAPNVSNRPDITLRGYPYTAE
jgi:hypothetical protein